MEARRLRGHGPGSVGEALLWAMEAELGDGFSPEVKEAWRELYQVVAGVMGRAGGLTAAAR